MNQGELKLYSSSKMRRKFLYVRIQNEEFLWEVEENTLSP
jgi:hypothetical protein